MITSEIKDVPEDWQKYLTKIQKEPPTTNENHSLVLRSGCFSARERNREPRVDTLRKEFH